MGTSLPGDNRSRDNSHPPLTVVMPAYNEEGSIVAAVEEIKAQVLDKVPGSYLIVVNDGSKDKTKALLDQLKINDSRIEVIDQNNMGHGPSLVRAFNQAQGEYIFQIDSDMQIPLSSFSNLWRLSKEADAVLGFRVNRQDPYLRLFLSAFTAQVLKKMFQVQLTDANAPCKLFKRKIWTEMFARLGDEKLLAPSMFLAIYAKVHHYKIEDVAVPHLARRTGKSTLRLIPLAKFCFNGLSQLIEYKEKLL